MEDEKFCTGYCRQMDCSRTVTVVLLDGRIEEVDCAYGSCLYQSSCPVAAKIEEL